MALDHHRAGAGEPLLLIHGIGHTWRGWRPMLPLLEERFEVLAVDLPGFGHSEPFPPGLDSTPEALADAVEDEMARAGFDTAHIAGNSLGGWIAFELARRGRAETVTALSPTGLRDAPSDRETARPSSGATSPAAPVIRMVFISGTPPRCS